MNFESFAESARAARSLVELERLFIDKRNKVHGVPQWKFNALWTECAGRFDVNDTGEAFEEFPF